MVKGTRIEGPVEAHGAASAEEGLDEAKRRQGGRYVDIDIYDGTSESGGRKRIKESEPSVNSEHEAAEVLAMLQSSAPPENLRIELKAPRARVKHNPPIARGDENLRPHVILQRMPELGHASALEARLQMLLKEQLTQTNFQKKGALPLSDRDFAQLSRVLAYAMSAGSKRYQEGQVVSAPDKSWTEVVPVTFEIERGKGTEVKVSLYGDRVSGGVSKKIRQKRVLRYDPQMESLRLGKAKVQVRARSPGISLEDDRDKLQDLVRRINEGGVDTDSDFFVAGHYKNIRTRKERSEGDEAQAIGSLDLIGPSMPSEQKAPLLADVAVTLAKLHHAGYTHGDVKPGNILVKNSDGQLRGFLTDWESLAQEGSPVTAFTKGFRDKSSIGGIQTRAGDMFALARCFQRLCAVHPNDNSSRALRQLSGLADAALINQDRLPEFFGALLDYYHLTRR